MRVEHDRRSKPERNRQRIKVVSEHDIHGHAPKTVECIYPSRALPVGVIVAAGDESTERERAPQFVQRRRREVDELIDDLPWCTKTGSDDRMAPPERSDLPVDARIAA